MENEDFYVAGENLVRTHFGNHAAKCIKNILKVFLSLIQLILCLECLSREKGNLKLYIKFISTKMLMAIHIIKIKTICGV